MFDAHARRVGSGFEAWTAEDGGRIRHRDPVSGAWAFQSVPLEVKDTLRRVFFLDAASPDAQTGWAVGQGGWVLKTTNGGVTWNAHGARIASLSISAPDPYEDLFDIHFLNKDEGWMVGRHSIWLTDNGGLTWTLLDPKRPDGSSYPLNPDQVQLYSIDAVERPDGSRLGLITGQPGIVFRSTDANLASWELVWDVMDLCALNNCGTAGAPLPSCACDICPTTALHPGPWLEPWDIQISHHATSPLALMCAGVAAQCGLIFASTDDGLTWQREWHECTCTGPGCLDCTNLALYNDDPNDPVDLNRHQELKTVYGLGIFASDNSAVAAAYNGQHLRRDPATGVWQDRSTYAAGVPTKPGAVIFPLVGAEAVEVPAGASLAIISGDGGHLRESTDGGNTYTDRAIGEPNRIADVFFKDEGTGFHVGQFFRICRSIDGGVVWDEQFPLSSANPSGYFNAVVFSPQGNMEGVAVGDPVLLPGGNDTVPMIRYTNFQMQTGNPQWAQAANILGRAAFINGKRLREATWSGGTEFWAVGSKGLILKSIDGGQVWRLVLPEPEVSLAEIEFEGVSFKDTTTGILVGRRKIGVVVQGVAYQYKNVGGTVTWTSLALPASLTTPGLTDVAISGSSAWVVGEKVGSNNMLEGVVLSSSWNGTDFGSFTDATPSQGILACTTGDALEDTPVLSEVDVAPNMDEVWVGGACGRLWSRTAAGVWTEEKSATDAHVVGLSFVPSGSGAFGFVAAFRNGQTQQCITRVQ